MKAIKSMKKIAPKNAPKKKKQKNVRQSFGQNVDQFGREMASMYEDHRKKKADEALAYKQQQEALEFQKFLRTLFQQIDVSDDGNISFEEFSMFLQSQGLNTDPQAVRKLICRVDQDGNDISFEEFASFFEGVVDIEGITVRIKEFEREAKEYLTTRQRMDLALTTINLIILFLCITLLAQELTYAVEEAAEERKRNSNKSSSETDANTVQYRPAVPILSFMIGLSGFYLLAKAMDKWFLPMCKMKIIKVGHEAELRANATERYMRGARAIHARIEASRRAREMEELGGQKNDKMMSIRGEQNKGWKEAAGVGFSIADIIKSQKAMKQRKTMGIAFDLRSHRASQAGIGVTSTTDNAKVGEKSNGEGRGQQKSMLVAPPTFRERRLIEKNRKGLKPGKTPARTNMWSSSQSCWEELANQVAFAPELSPVKEKDKNQKPSLVLTRALRDESVAKMMQTGDIWGTLAKVVDSGSLSAIKAKLRKKSADEESSEMRALRKDIRLGDGVKFPEHLALGGEAARHQRKHAGKARKAVEKRREALEEAQRAEEEARRNQEEWIRTYCGNLREIKIDRTPIIQRPTRSSPYHPNSFHEANKAQQAKYAFNPMNPSKAYLIGCPMKIPNNYEYDIEDQTESEFDDDEELDRRR